MSQLHIQYKFTIIDNNTIDRENQDYIAIWDPHDPEEETKHGWLFIIADGISSNDKSEIASKYICEQIESHYLNQYQVNDFTQRLKLSFEASGEDLKRYAASNHPGGSMAVTVIAAVCWNDQIYIAHSGLCRGYLYRQKQLTQLTQDHSVAARFGKNVTLQSSDLATLSAINSYNSPFTIDLHKYPLEDKDYILLCSNGLSQSLSFTEIDTILAMDLPISQIIKEFVRRIKKGNKINNKKYLDDVSIILIKVHLQPEKSPQLEKTKVAQLRLDNLRKLMVTHFNLEELKSFCFDNFKDFHDNTSFHDDLNSKTISLIDYCKRHGLLDHLIDCLKHERPFIQWD